MNAVNLNTRDIWFTSDLHLGHDNIRRYCDRPFSSLDSMNEALITNFNEVVKPDDNIYILGDLVWKKDSSNLDLIKRLNGNKFWIRGNHDARISYNECYNNEFVWVKDYHELKIRREGTNGKTTIVMCHFPFESWHKMSYNSIHLFGHCHGNLKPNPEKKRIDVGVDCHDYYPISLNRVFELSDKLGINSTNYRNKKERTARGILRAFQTKAGYALKNWFKSI